MFQHPSKSVENEKMRLGTRPMGKVSHGSVGGGGGGFRCSGFLCVCALGRTNKPIC